jgi:hypothetical protein
VITGNIRTEIYTFHTAIPIHHYSQASFQIGYQKMFKSTFTRLILTTSPVELLFGIRSSSSADGNNVVTCSNIRTRRALHIYHNRNVHLLRVCSSTTPSIAGTAAAAASGSVSVSAEQQQAQAASTTLKDLQQWAVNVTKVFYSIYFITIDKWHFQCGIPKDFGGSQEEVLQQQQRERNVFGDDGSCSPCLYTKSDIDNMAYLISGVGVGMGCG